MLEDTNDYKKLNIVKCGIIGISILVIIVTASLALSDDTTWYMQNIKYVLPVVSALLIVCSEFYVRVEQKMVLHDVVKQKTVPNGQVFSQDAIEGILQEYSGNYLDNSLPPKELPSKTSEERARFRKLLNCCAIIVLGAVLLISVFFHIQYLFVAAACVSSIIYIYIDYITHARRYTQKYDRRFTKDKTDAYRGLARLYLEEYKKTKFDQGNRFYRDIQDKEHSLECKKHILNMSLDHVNNVNLILGIILMLLNIMLLFPQTEKYLVDLFAFIRYEREGEFLYNMAYLTVMVVTGVLNSYSCCQRGTVEKSTRKALMTYIEDKDKFNQEFMDSKELFSPLIECRGIFQYTMERLDGQKGSEITKGIEEINWEDRMLFVHRAQANVSRLNLTIILSGLTCFFVSMQIWGFQIWYILYLVIALFLRYILKKYYLPVIGKKKIVKWCKKLEMEQRKEDEK